MNTPELEIVIVRHGETAWNCINRIQGQLDIPLNEKGLQQAGRVAERLAGEHFDHAYTSDLARTLVTAKKIVPGVPVHPVPELREWNLGLWQGKTLAEVDRECPGGMAKFSRQDKQWHAPGGECFEDVYMRIQRFFEQLVREHPGEKILIVSHCGPIRTMFQYLMQCTGLACQPQIENASISRFRWKGNAWQLICWNDSSHLNGIGTLNGRY